MTQTQQSPRQDPPRQESRAQESPQTQQPPLSYEQARGELVEVVQRLEAGGSTLEESLALWERGEELARICSAWLEGARARLDAVLESGASADQGRDEDQEGDAAEDEAGDGAHAADAVGSDEADTDDV